MDDEVPVNSTTTTSIASSSNAKTAHRKPRKSVFLGVFALSRPGEYEKVQAETRAKDRAQKQQKQRQERTQAKEAAFASQRNHVKRKHDAGDETDSASSRESSFDAAGLVATAEPHSWASTPTRSNPTKSTSPSSSENVYKKLRTNSPSGRDDTARILQGDERSAASSEQANNNICVLSHLTGDDSMAAPRQQNPVRTNSSISEPANSQEGDGEYSQNGASRRQSLSANVDASVPVSRMPQMKNGRERGSESPDVSRPRYSATPELPFPEASKVKLQKKTPHKSPLTVTKQPTQAIVISDSDSSEGEEGATGEARLASKSSSLKEDVVGDSEEEETHQLQPSSKARHAISSRKLPRLSRTRSPSDSEEANEEDPDITMLQYEIKDNSADSDYSDSDQALRHRKVHQHSEQLSKAAPSRGKSSSRPKSASTRRAGPMGRPPKQKPTAPIYESMDIDGQESALPANPAQRPRSTLAKGKGKVVPANRSRPLSQAGTRRLSRDAPNALDDQARYPIKNTRSQTAAGSASSSLLCHQCEVYHDRSGILHCVSCERGMCPKCMYDRYHAYPTYAAHLLYLQTSRAGTTSWGSHAKPPRRQKTKSTTLERQGSGSSASVQHPVSDDSDADIPLINASLLQGAVDPRTHLSTDSQSSVGGIHMLDFQCPVCKAVCNCANCLRGPYPRPETVRCKPTEAERLGKTSNSQSRNGRSREARQMDVESASDSSSDNHAEHATSALPTSRSSTSAHTNDHNITKPPSSDQMTSRRRVRLKFNGIMSSASGERMSAIERAEARRAAIDAETDYVPVVAARAAPRATSSEVSNAVPRLGSPPRHRYASTSDGSESQTTTSSRPVGASTSTRVRMATTVGEQLGKSPASLLFAAASAIPRIEGDQLIPFNSDEPVFTLPSQIDSTSTGVHLSLQHDDHHDLSAMSFPFQDTKPDLAEADVAAGNASDLSTEALGTVPDLVYQTGDDEQATPSIPSPAEDSQPQPAALPPKQQLFGASGLQRSPAFTVTDALSVPLTLPHSPEVGFGDLSMHKLPLDPTASDKLYVPDYFDSAILRSYIDDEAMSGYLNFAAFDDGPREDEVAMAQ